jgi:hypothetical protein
VPLGKLGNPLKCAPETIFEPRSGKWIFSLYTGQNLIKLAERKL